VLSLDEILARKLQEEENIQKEYPFKNSNHFNVSSFIIFIIHNVKENIFD